MPKMDANTVWATLLYDVFLNGKDSAPRGQPIRELLGYQTKIDMQYPLVTFKDREMGYKFTAAEAAWIISGDDRVETISPFSRAIKHFSDDGVVFAGAYGPKIESQLQYVVETLMGDPDSRQAVLNIWRENPPKSKDIPCTLSAQWIIRDGKLHCIDTMRSSDVWLGWVYDVFNFSMLSAYVLLELKRLGGPQFRNLTLGTLTLNAGSQHLYKRDWAKVEALSKQDELQFQEYPAFQPQKVFVNAKDLLDNLWAAARGDGALDLMHKCGKAIDQ